MQQQLLIGTVRNDNSMRALLTWASMFGYTVTDFMKSRGRLSGQNNVVLEDFYDLVLHNVLANGEVNGVEDKLGYHHRANFDLLIYSTSQILVN